MKLSRIVTHRVWQLLDTEPKLKKTIEELTEDRRESLYLNIAKAVKESLIDGMNI